MEKKDENRFAMAMAKTKVSLPGMKLDAKEDALRIQVFWEELIKYSIEEVELALKRARGSLSFFPEPTTIKEFIFEEREKNKPRQIEHLSPMKPEERERISKLIRETIERLSYPKSKVTPADLRAFLKMKPPPVLSGEEAERFEKEKEKRKKQAKLLRGIG